MRPRLITKTCGEAVIGAKTDTTSAIETDNEKSVKGLDSGFGVQPFVFLTPYGWTLKEQQ